MQRRLGRGLGSLLSGGETAPSTDRIELHRIRPNPFQPRQSFDPGDLEELTASIRTHGVLQPVVLRRVSDGFELVAGERRWRAARLAGLKEIPAVVRPEVRDDEMLELALVENVQRRDLDPIERGQGYHALQEKLGLTQDQVAAKVGLQRTTVANHVRLLELPRAAQDAVRKGLIDMGHARALLGLASEGERLRLLETVIREELSVREVERRVRGAQPAAKPPSRPEGQSRLPPWAQELESRLRDRYATKVTLKLQPGFRGQITLDYADRSDLERLIQLLAPRPTL